jgi:hypothetical protein
VWGWADCPEDSRQQLLWVLTSAPSLNSRWSDLESDMELGGICLNSTSTHGGTDASGRASGASAGLRLLQAKHVASASHSVMEQLQKAEQGDPSTMLKPLQTLLLVGLGGQVIKVWCCEAECCC